MPANITIKEMFLECRKAWSRSSFEAHLLLKLQDHLKAEEAIQNWDSDDAVDADVFFSCFWKEGGLLRGETAGRGAERGEERLGAVGLREAREPADLGNPFRQASIGFQNIETYFATWNLIWQI